MIASAVIFEAAAQNFGMQKQFLALECARIFFSGLCIHGQKENSYRS